jgi:glycosyltransferase involved in cell wall biosynthesis
MGIDLRNLTVGIVSTYPPTRCGVGRFSHALCRMWSVLAPNFDLRINRIIAGPEVMGADDLVEAFFDPASPTAVRSVSRRLARTDVALVHHEFGIYGPSHGRAVVDLVRDTAVPVVSVLHTVLARPSTEQRRIVESLSAKGPLVVPTETAHLRLLRSHDLDAESVRVIGHGTAWSPTPLRRARRRKLISWGLLGPGKGIERALQALALITMDPPVTYDIVGQTHPRVRERYGERYRHELEELTRHLGLDHRVRFVDRYLSDDELMRAVAGADVAVIPYDDPDQVCSGTLLDALGLGKPVVATSFPHARELLSEGGGSAVERTPEALAEAVVRFLEDDDAYAKAAQEAARQGSLHTWQKVSVAYADTIHRARLGAGVS